MTKRDAAATRQRILDAATVEFSTHGFAGARIDRIADAAEANKRMIYAYFGNKDGLFDTVVTTALEELHDTVPFDAADLPAYGARVFDFLEEHPELLKIDRWRKLERPEATHMEQAFIADKVDAITAAAGSDACTGQFGAADALVVVLALASAWATAPAALTSLATQDRNGRRELVQRSLNVLISAPDEPSKTRSV